MKVKGLRIGNYVYDSKEVEKVTPEHISNFNFLDISPIPITEQWLIDFGFEKTRYVGYSNFYMDLKSMSLDIENVHVGNHYNIFLDDVDLNIKYIHQLQNLYFALTGEELTIKN